MNAIPIVKISEISDYIKRDIREIKFVCEVTEKIILDEDKLTVIRVRDDTGLIDVKLFGDKEEREFITKDISRGDKLLIVGYVVELDSEIYISPKGIRKINDEWYDYYLLRYLRFRKKQY